jgi:hypothetical protein
LDLERTVIPSTLDFLWCVCMKSEIYKRNLDTGNEFFSRIPEAAAHLQKCDQLRRKPREFHTQGAKCIEVDGGVFLHLLWNVNIFFVYE